jgi:hypothetical protein
VVLKKNGLTHRRIQPHCPEENALIERANQTLREGLEGEELSKYLELEHVLDRLGRGYNEERLHSALGYLPPWEFYRGDPQRRCEERRGKLFQARPGRRERNLELRQGTLPLEGGRLFPPTEAHLRHMRCNATLTTEVSAWRTSLLSRRGSWTPFPEGGLIPIKAGPQPKTSGSR